MQLATVGVSKIPANMNIINDINQIPLHSDSLLCLPSLISHYNYFQTGDVLLVKTLLAFGANINDQGLNDFTPLDLAIHCQSPEVEKVLLEHGAKGSAKLIVQQQRPSVVGWEDGYYFAYDIV